MHLNQQLRTLKKLFTKSLITGFIFIIYSLPGNSQKELTGINAITSSDLESHVSFLASPLLKGRSNGSEHIEIAAQYIASQAQLIGLKPANGNSYFQFYKVDEKVIDTEKSQVLVIKDGKDTVRITEPLFQLLPQGPSDFVIEGDVVFAGYGIRNDKYNYNDLGGISPEGKILLIMNRAPSSEDGKKFIFEGADWSSFRNVEAKLSNLLYSRAKGILVVMDPKSGFRSFDEQYPGIAGQLSSTITLSGEKTIVMDFPGMPRIIFVHRNLADRLLEGTGASLEELQKKIDAELKPKSFLIGDRKISITEVSMTRGKLFKNVAAYCEGRDNDLKDEYIVFSAHYDHIGEQGGSVNAGADDDASGCAALLSIGEAFQSLDQKPLRSVLFLWVSGEELGLFGSKSYVSNPLVPLKNTVANLNMDMIGRVKSEADSTGETPMSGPETVFVITDNQSKELTGIADEIDKKSNLDFDYALSGRTHPLQLFRRSDHFNFVKNDIPVLFFTTGLHSDYHSPRDVTEKLDFTKMELVTRTMYEIGLNVANKKQRLKIDNPYSTWQKR